MALPTIPAPGPDPTPSQATPPSPAPAPVPAQTAAQRNQAPGGGPSLTKTAKMPAPVPQPRNHRSTTGSKIIPVEKRDLFLTITMVFVIANVIPHMWANLTVLSLLLVYTLMVFFHRFKPLVLPGILARSAEDFADRVKENPWDLLTILGIVLLTLAKDVYLREVSPAWSELFSILLIVLAVRLSRTRPYRIPSQAGPLHGLQVWWMRLIGKSPSRPMLASGRSSFGPAQPVELEAPVDAPVAVEEDPDKIREEDPIRDVWEERQRARWRDWIDEEVHRLDEDRKKRK